MMSAPPSTSTSAAVNDNEDDSLIMSSQSYLTALDPLFHSYVHIFARYLRHMEPVKGFGHNNPPLYFFCFPPTYQPRPIHHVTIAGIVVYAYTNMKCHTYVVDDASDVVECVYWKNDHKSKNNGNDSSSNSSELVIPHVELAQFIRVVGLLKWKRGKPFVSIEQIQTYSDPNAELLWWIQLKRIHEQVYCKPFPIINHVESSQQSQQK